ncbi:TonB-dependent receptor, partial [uncultured Chitinophaga sp.]|uniref:TonB-dependent receptor n=1 Tax=uncultured Chitinophaga sp. TaxID=339340 RepID=UPI0025E1E01E
LGFGAASILSPLNPIRDVNGNYVLNYAQGTNGSRPVANTVAANEYNKNNITSYRAVNTLRADLKFLKYFNLSSTLGFDFLFSETYRKSDPRLQFGESNSYGLISEYSVKRANLISTNAINFSKTFSDIHSLSALVAQEAQIITGKNVYIQATGTSATLPYYDELNSPGYTNTAAVTTKDKTTLLSQFGQVQYALKNKYFLSGSYRRDGSSLFGTHQQWADYWSAGAGWIVSEEKFMRSLERQLTYLKLRGSFGIAGNSANVSVLSKYDLLRQELLNGQLAVIPAEQPGNPEIKWESTFSWNFGIDARLWQDRLELTLDLYKKYTKNLIYATNLPAHSGYVKVADNIGDMNNNGFELNLRGHIIRSKNFTWSAIAMWSTNKNVLVKAYVPLEKTQAESISNEEGRNYNSYYMPVWMGVNTETGLPQWKDSTGKPTSIYASAKKEFVGKPQPDGFASLLNTVSWKGIELNVQLYYQYGFDIYDSQLSVSLSDGVYPYMNSPKSALNRWQQPGDVAANPVRKLNNTNNGNFPSTRFLSKGDYLRLQQIGLAYSLPSDIVRRLKLSSLKLYAQGFNIHQWSLNKEVNPDNATASGRISFSYPQAQSYSLGINANF